MSFIQSTDLLAKRCYFIENNMKFSTDIPDEAPAGYQFKHFVLHGLVHAAYKDGNASKFYEGTHTDSPTTSAMAGSHLRGLHAFDYETIVDAIAIPLAHIREHGLDPSTDKADEYLGLALRQAFGSDLHECYAAAYGVHIGGAENITQHYKGREILPKDNTASWADQQVSLLSSAKENSLVGLLSQQHVVSNYGYFYGWSPRRAGFPVRQFQGNPLDARHILSPHTYKDTGNSFTPNNEMYATAIQSNPTVTLVTIQVPDDFDVLVAGETLADVTVKMYSRHLTVPHWIGRGVMLQQDFFAEGEPDKSLSDQRLYDGYANGADQVTIAALYDPNDVNNNEYGDYLLYTPSDNNDAYGQAIELTCDYVPTDSVGGSLITLGVEYLSNAETYFGGTWEDTVLQKYSYMQVAQSNLTFSFRLLSPRVMLGYKIYYSDDTMPAIKRVTHGTISTQASSPTNTLVGGWTISQTKSIPVLTADDDGVGVGTTVMFDSPTERTNMFEFTFNGSAEGTHQGLQYVEPIFAL
jgi:hypothetical protein